jgi:hypothetical protein
VAFVCENPLTTDYTKKQRFLNVFQNSLHTLGATVAGEEITQQVKANELGMLAAVTYIHPNHKR